MERDGDVSIVDLEVSQKTENNRRNRIENMAFLWKQSILYYCKLKTTICRVCTSSSMMHFSHNISIQYDDADRRIVDGGWAVLQMM